MHQSIDSPPVAMHTNILSLHSHHQGPRAPQLGQDLLSLPLSMGPHTCNPKRWEAKRFRVWDHAGIHSKKLSETKINYEQWLLSLCWAVKKIKPLPWGWETQGEKQSAHSGGPVGVRTWDAGTGFLCRLRACFHFLHQWVMLALIQTAVHTVQITHRDSQGMNHSESPLGSATLERPVRMPLS